MHQKGKRSPGENNGVSVVFSSLNSKSYMCVLRGNMKISVVAHF